MEDQICGKCGGGGDQRREFGFETCGACGGIGLARFHAPSIPDSKIIKAADAAAVRAVERPREGRACGVVRNLGDRQ